MIVTPSLLTSACFGTFGASIVNFWKYYVWLSITDEGSVPEMRIWSILLIKYDLKWCIHLSRSVCSYIKQGLQIRSAPKQPTQGVGSIRCGS